MLPISEPSDQDFIILEDEGRLEAGDQVDMSCADTKNQESKTSTFACELFDVLFDSSVRERGNQWKSWRTKNGYQPREQDTKDSKEDGWTYVRRYRDVKNTGNTKYQSKEPATSFFIQKIPEELTEKELWTECKQYGQVVDAYITRKKDRHRGRNDNGVNGRLPRASYSDIVKGRMVDHPDVETIRVNIQTEAYKRWKKYSLIAEVKEVWMLNEITSIVRSMGVMNAEFRYLWGLKVLITFNSTVEARRLVLEGKEQWSKHFVNLEVWDGQLIKFERIAWLKIMGTPIHLWDARVFNQIGESIGKVVIKSEASLEDGNLGYDKFGVLLQHGDQINRKCLLMAGGVSFECWVHEMTETWFPTWHQVEKNVKDLEGNIEDKNSPDKLHFATAGEVPSTNDQMIGDEWENEESGVGGGTHEEIRFSKPRATKTRKLKRSKGKSISSHQVIVKDTFDTGDNTLHEEDYGSDWLGDSDGGEERERGIADTYIGNQSLAEEEIQKTLEVGECLGMDIRGFEQQIRNLISDEQKERLNNEELVFNAEQQEEYWGNQAMEKVIVEPNGRSGGLLSVWNPTVFKIQVTVKNQNFIVTGGDIIGESEKMFIVNVYAPNDPKKMERSLGRITGNQERICGDMGICGEAGLLEYSLGGKKFTHMTGSGDKLSRIDRVLVCDGFMNKWPMGSVKALNREYSDHSPLLLSIKELNFGPTPFRFYNSWLELDSLDKVVKTELEVYESRAPKDIMLATTLGLKSDVGNGRKTLFWTDHWMDGMILCDEFPRVFKIAKLKKAKVCDYFNMTGDIVFWDWEWERDPSSLEEWMEIGKLMGLLAKVVINNKEDVWGWKNYSGDTFAVKEVRKAIVDAYSSAQVRGIQLNVACKLCGFDLESANHLMVTCIVAKAIWWQVWVWIKVPIPHQLLYVEAVFEYIDAIKIEKGKKKLFNAIGQVTYMSYMKQHTRTTVCEADE
ncbi:hypothetical protein E3N88_00855 [Mikania micrantha]|uniref:Uncharacterized protein n=1 Tax=Mikania micrantha TaxID=192012 RepID=A0A5N6PZB9_9ASTR|nr:hypothetical protein E3N88_00855 [Mikania micrantha]